MSALLEHGIEVTALHNHFFWDEPRVFFMHVHGHSKAVDLANQLKPALDLIGLAKEREENALRSGSKEQLSIQNALQKLVMLVNRVVLFTKSHLAAMT
jgi:uncharacterized protein DUF1259